jgi:hypothetical protein
MAFFFLQRLSTFFNSFPIFLKGFPNFLKAIFCFPTNPIKSIYSGKYTKYPYSSFVIPATRSPSFLISASIYGSKYTKDCYSSFVFPAN